jgi:hypothetical protein
MKKEIKQNKSKKGTCKETRNAYSKIEREKRQKTNQKRRNK